MQLRIATGKISALKTKGGISQTITKMTRRSVLLTSRERGMRRKTWQTTTLVTIAANTTTIRTAQLIGQDTTKLITTTSEMTGMGTARMHTDAARITPETVIGTAAEILPSRWVIRMA